MYLQCDAGDVTRQLPRQLAFELQGDKHAASFLGCLLVVCQAFGYWIRLVQHCFSSLKWPDEVPPHDPGVSLLEIMLDLCISYQVRPPINAALNKLRLPGVPVLPPKSPAKYVLLSRMACACLPPDTLTASAHTFLLTCDFLYPRILMTPFPHANLRSLAHLGFSNVVPSLKATPALLSGSEAKRLLSQTLVPGIVSSRIPIRSLVVIRFPFLPDFPLTSDSLILIRQSPSTSHTARWGRTLLQRRNFGFLGSYNGGLQKSIKICCLFVPAPRFKSTATFSSQRFVPKTSGAWGSPGTQQPPMHLH